MLRPRLGYAGGMTESLSICCTLPTSGATADPAALGALAGTAEELGFDSVWISDRVVIPQRLFVERVGPGSATRRRVMERRDD